MTADVDPEKNKEKMKKFNREVKDLTPLSPEESTEILQQLDNFAGPLSDLNGGMEESEASLLIAGMTDAARTVGERVSTTLPIGQSFEMNGTNLKLTVTKYDGTTRPTRPMAIDAGSRPVNSPPVETTTDEATASTGKRDL
jgi:hypothetical protein